MIKLGIDVITGFEFLILNKIGDFMSEKFSLKIHDSVFLIFSLVF